MLTADFNGLNLAAYCLNLAAYCLNLAAYFLKNQGCLEMGC